MPITEEQSEKLTLIFSDIEANMKLLNDWERGFIRDQITRFDKYGDQMYLSVKQMAAIEKIHTKVVGEVKKVDDEIPY